MIGAVIMASGSSKRMGKNKLLLEYNGKPLILHTIENVLQLGFQDIVVVTRHNEVAEISRDKNLKCVYNICAEMGQSESIKLGLKNLKACDGYMFFTGDQPLLDDVTINALTQCFENHKESIIVPAFKGRRGNPVIFPGKFKDELLNLTGDTGGRSILYKHPLDIILVEIANEYALWDIDTPEDYKNLIHIEKGK